ncbi:MAG: 2-C-methyl-D-erythritol 4-phosphate cytidylyltransferase, partial [Actinomycetota bacterium]|nr:2-C-methyl-D-erythritol 4-phosphate cytidylyltransferase [Actinomycetota bacterium]
MSIWTVVVAAGRGDRFGADKQSADLCGRAVLERSVVAAGGSDGVVVVVAPTAVEEVAERFAGVDKVSAVVAGGATRSASVRAGLVVVPDDASIVLVHDGARPLAPPHHLEPGVAPGRARAAPRVPGVPVRD